MGFVSILNLRRYVGGSRPTVSPDAAEVSKSRTRRPGNRIAPASCSNVPASDVGLSWRTIPSRNPPGTVHSRDNRTIALMLESDAPGGAEIFLLHSAEELRKRRHHVVPVLPSWKTGWLAGEFRKRGFDPHQFTLRRPLDWRCLKGLAATLRSTGVEVVHSHEFTMAVYGTVAARLLGIRHVITMHGNDRMTLARRRRIALRWAFRHSHATVAVSEDTRRHLLETMSLPPEQVRTIPNGIPEPRGDADGPRIEFRLSADEVVFISVGNLTERKGHIVLLRALQQVRDQGCTVPWRLIVAGEGPERPRLEAFVQEHDLVSSVLLPGYRADVGDLQAVADVMVMPSLWEGLPLAVLEGMFAGNAILGSDTSGIPEAVRQGVDGLLTPPGDVGALAASLRTLLEDPELRRRMGRNAHERARARFSIRRMVDDYEALYSGGAGPVPTTEGGAHTASWAEGRA